MSEEWRTAPLPPVPGRQIELYQQPPQGPYPPVWGPQQPYPPQPVPQVWGPPPTSDKGKLAAGLLQLLLPLVGICGVGRLYAGHTGVGLTQLLVGIAGLVLGCCGASMAVFIAPLVLCLITPGVAVWSMIDGIIIMCSAEFRDGRGLLMR